MKLISKLGALIGGVLLLIACDEDKFLNQSRISGVVYYADLESFAKSDTAKGTTLAITEIDKGRNWEMTLPKGVFDVAYLNEGSHQLKFSYKNGAVTYTFDTLLYLEKEGDIPLFPVLQPVDGYFRMEGIVSIMNEQFPDRRNTPVDHALVELLNVDDSTVINAATTIDDGVFEMENISNGNYLVKVTYLQDSVITYEKYFEQTVSGTHVLNMNYQIPFYTEAPILKVIVRDINNQEVAGAQVCLYINEAIYNSRPGFCLGSYLSAITNQYGVVLFPNISEDEYFIDGVFRFDEETQLQGNNQITVLGNDIVEVPISVQ